MKTREAYDCTIDCQTINTVEAQKSIKNIVKYVHLPSVVQSEGLWRDENTVCTQRKKKEDFIQQFVSSVSA